MLVALALNRMSMVRIWHLVTGGDSKRGAGLGERARALLDLANKCNNDTKPGGRKFRACANVCIPWYGLSCCPSGHDIDTARYYYYGDQLPYMHHAVILVVSSRPVVGAVVCESGTTFLLWVCSSCGLTLDMQVKKYCSDLLQILPPG